jgi:Kef-type K+ transport system membrane component KefB
MHNQDMGHLLLGIAIMALVIAIWIVPLWRILARTGHSPALSLVAIVPIFGLILLWWLAFAEWPNHPTTNS